MLELDAATEGRALFRPMLNKLITLNGCQAMMRFLLCGSLVVGSVFLVGCTVETLKKSFSSVPGVSTNFHGVPRQSEPDLEKVEAELAEEDREREAHQ